MADEEALLKQFAAQFAHGPNDADDTDAAAAAQHANNPENQAATNAEQSSTSFDTQQFLNGLDAISTVMRPPPKPARIWNRRWLTQRMPAMKPDC